jgi:microcystin-dependent protein
MGIFANLSAQKLSFTDDRHWIGRWLIYQLSSPDKLDPPTPTAATGTNTIHLLNRDVVETTGGTFTLTFNLKSNESFTTAAIAFNANAATIEGAIDTAATLASITDWSNGDIAVTGTDLQNTDISLTFSGASVSGQPHAITVMTDSRTGGTPASTLVTSTSRGSFQRNAWAALLALDVIRAPIPAFDAIATEVAKGQNRTNVPYEIIKAMAVEATFEDDNQNSYFSIVGSLFPQDRAPLVEPIGEITLLQTSEGEDMEIGSIVAFGGSSAPTTWLLCDGSSQLVAAYPDLHSVIGYTYGGSGANFTLPDLRGRTPIGVGSGAGLTARSLADSSGAEKITDVPEHNHPLLPNAIEAPPLLNEPDGSSFAEDLIYKQGTPVVTTNPATTDNAGTAGGVNVMNPFLALNFIIKAS